MKQLTWNSAFQEKGWEGLNNAAIYSFGNDIMNSFVREMIQNSNDARDNDLPVDVKTNKSPPVNVKINYTKINVENFPSFDDFYGIFKLIAGSKPNKVHAKFFNNAFKALKDKKKIKFFIYEDYNTTGLSGKDDDPDSTFSSCVLSEGTSVDKDETAGGSFGIGKNAIFGFSKLRTVFYVSLNKNNEYVFQGISKLASYYDVNKKPKRSRIFCGLGNELKSVRDINKLPDNIKDTFRRDKPGLSQFAVCPIEDPDWQNQFIKAILRNYWLLIYKEGLTLELSENESLVCDINANNLESLLKEHFCPEHYKPDKIKPEGNPYEYYLCVKRGNYIEEDLDILGSVKFYYRELDNKDTNRVAYMRNNMVVYSEPIYGFGNIGYCGVFICTNNSGNRILRDMEPPTHDNFSPDMLDSRSKEYNKRDGKKIIDEVSELIKKTLQTIIDKYKQPAENIEWLDELLGSLTGQGGSGKGDRTNIESEVETPERIGNPISMSLNFSTLRKNTIINHQIGKIQDNGGGTGLGTGGGPGEGSVGSGGGQGGGPTGHRISTKSKIKSRVYKINKSISGNGRKLNGYRIILDSDEAIDPTDILISQKGDSGQVVSFRLIKVINQDRDEFLFSKEKDREGNIIAYRIKSVNVPIRMEMYIDEHYKSSFKILKS